MHFKMGGGGGVNNMHVSNALQNMYMAIELSGVRYSMIILNWYLTNYHFVTQGWILIQVLTTGVG